jgi:hypothetical protein
MSQERFRLVRCDECGVTSPRDPAELARPSGKYCLICGTEREQGDKVAEPVSSITAERKGQCR